MKAIRVQYLPATETKPARYKATAEGVKPLIMSASGTRRDTPAIALCERQGWSGTLVSGGLPDGSEVFCFMDSDKVEVPA